MAVSQNENHVFLPSSKVSLIDWVHLSSMTILHSLKPAEEEQANRGLLMNIRIVDANFLLAGYENGSVALFDLNTKTEISELKLFEGKLSPSPTLFKEKLYQGL